MKRLLAGIVFGFCLALFSAATVQAADCQFVLGFKTIRDLIGHDVVGGCLDNEHYNAIGDTIVSNTPRVACSPGARPTIGPLSPMATAPGLTAPMGSSSVSILSVSNGRPTMPALLVRRQRWNSPARRCATLNIALTNPRLSAVGSLRIATFNCRAVSIRKAKL